MSILLRNRITGITTSTDLFGEDLALFLREYPDLVKVGIGTTTNQPYYILLNETTEEFRSPYVNGNFVYNPGLNRLGIGSNNPQATLDVNGDVFVTGIVTATDYNSASDIRLKENIQKIDNPIDKIIRIEGVTFDWKSSNKSSMGVIAQNIEKVLPQLVNGEDSKTVNYNGIIGLLIECVKTQQEQIDNLNRRIEGGIQRLLERIEK